MAGRVRSLLPSLWLLLCTSLLAILPASGALAATIFSETFDGYTYFPDQIPLGDPVNTGVPLQSEGADEVWYAARFQPANSLCADGTVNCDVAVQSIGGNGNNTPVGRFEDDSGLLFRVDTTNLVDLVLSYDWRTFSATSSDKLVMGYFVGDIPASVWGPDNTADLQGGAYDWSNWTELARQSAHDIFSHETFALPDNVGPLWVAFWIDNGEGDYGKIDNVVVTANTVPEPGTALLLGLGLIGLAARRRS